MKPIDITGLIAVLRGITPAEIVPVSQILCDTGWGAIEITLNSPNAYESLQILHKHFKHKCLIGAGTVLTVADVQKIADIGLDFIISPNMNRDVIRETKKQGLLSIPGVFTPTEAFDALDAGADALKIFPGESVTPAFIKAMRAVLPSQTMLYITGGIDTHNMQSFLQAGINGFGIGGSVYKPNLPFDIIEKNAKALCNAFVSSSEFGLNLE
jgi:2-dehydro-3-deoxyphosphogalactonate aldolase